MTVYECPYCATEYLSTSLHCCNGTSTGRETGALMPTRRIGIKCDICNGIVFRLDCWNDRDITISARNIIGLIKRHVEQHASGH